MIARRKFHRVVFILAGVYNIDDAYYIDKTGKFV
jgi:hypothetical protein